MTARRTYLDWNASAPLKPEARAAMVSAMDAVGNPSSVHAEGRRARDIIEAARVEVARLVNANPADVVFTSGATEANAQVLRGRDWDVVIASDIEHPSIVGMPRGRGLRLKLASNPHGQIDVNQIDINETVRGVIAAKGGDAVLWSMQLANGETGVLQPVADAVALSKGSGFSVLGLSVVVHTDAVQAVGKVAVDFGALGVDALTLSAHKIGGPKGVGALVMQRGLTLGAMFASNGQERGRRAGTENVIGIAGFGAAAKAARADLAQAAQIAARRDALERAVIEATPSAVILGCGVARLPNTSMIALPGQKAETLVIRLDLSGVSVSAGAACSSGKVGPNAVLAAMGVDPALSTAAVRISIGPETTDDDIAAFIAAWQSIAASRARAAA